MHIYLVIHGSVSVYSFIYRCVCSLMYLHHTVFFFFYTFSSWLVFILHTCISFTTPIYIYIPRLYLLHTFPSSTNLLHHVSYVCTPPTSSSFSPPPRRLPTLGCLPTPTPPPLVIFYLILRFLHRTFLCLLLLLLLSCS